MGIRFQLQWMSPRPTALGAKDLSSRVLLPGLGLGKHRISKQSHIQTTISCMTIVRAPSPVQTWIDHRFHPPLSGHRARARGRFKRYAQVPCQCWHIDTPFLTVTFREDMFISEI
jgi:hypothetical protein